MDGFSGPLEKAVNSLNHDASACYWYVKMDLIKSGRYASVTYHGLYPNESEGFGTTIALETLQLSSYII